MIPLPAQRIDELRDCLLRWFQSERRTLPWRSHRTCYGTWIAEIMLQQTTVATVIPYWHRFLARFPDVMALSQGPIDDVLQMWQGLGYYRRARQLHQAAGQVAENGGQFPETREQWQELPGVGPYASGAIASQAQGVRAPAVDANARRVLTRWLVNDVGQLPELTGRKLEKIADCLVPETMPGDWNEALMELGALVCTARNPRCDECPVLHLCQAGLAGRASEIPPRKSARVKPMKVDVALVALKTPQGIWLVPASSPIQIVFSHPAQMVRDDFSGLHQGLWGLPATAWVSSRKDKTPPSIRLLPSALEELSRWGLSVERLQKPMSNPVGRFDHAITRYRLNVWVFFQDMVEVSEPIDPVVVKEPSAVTSCSADKESFKSFLKKDALGVFLNGTSSQALSGLALKALGLIPADPTT